MYDDDRIFFELEEDEKPKKKENVFFGEQNVETEQKLKKTSGRDPVKKTVIRITSVLLVIALIIGAYYFGSMSSTLTNPEYSFYQWACDTLNERAYFVHDKLDQKLVFEYGIYAAMQDDPYFTIYTPEDTEELLAGYDGKNTAIGMTLVEYELVEGLYVSEVIRGSSAEQNGIQVDYRVVSVNDIDFYTATLNDLSAYITTIPDNTDIVIKFAIPSYNEDATLNFDLSNTITITVQRTEFIERVVDYYDDSSADFQGVLDEETAYIALRSFQGDVKAQFDAAMAIFKQRGKHNLILDLRGNLGGSDYNLQAVAEHLIRSSANTHKVLILEQQYKDGSKTQLYTEDCRYDEYNFDKIVVLTDGNTASASEALLLAMIDYGTVDCIIGGRTFGKGTGIETVFMPILNYAISYTSSYFYSPFGNTNEKVGITPTPGYAIDYDYTNNLPYQLKKDNQILRAINYLK
ncbi:MAG: PDZ domain-containing protein [Clostridia bacterium]|nr:PDZ domain-containing protein [Clostridia bacterium]